MEYVPLSLNSLVRGSILYRALSLVLYEKQGQDAGLGGYRIAAELATSLMPILYGTVIIDAEYPGSIIGYGGPIFQLSLQQAWMSFAKEVRLLVFCPVTILQHIGFDRGSWCNVKTFRCTASPISANTYLASNIAPVVNRNACYLIDHLPSLTEIDIIVSSPDGLLFRLMQTLNMAVCNKLMGATLDLSTQSFLIPRLPTTLQALGYTRTCFHPSLAANLKLLDIKVMCANFPWCIFASPWLVSYPSPKMAFPSLKRLVASRLFAKHAGFYGYIANSPLKSVKVTEIARDASLIDPLVVSGIDDFHLDLVASRLPGMRDDISVENAVRGLFGTRSPLRTATLVLGGLSFPRIETAEWCSLSSLHFIVGTVELACVCCLLQQLPRLRMLRIESEFVSAAKVFADSQDGQLSTTLESLALLSISAMDRQSCGMLRRMVSRIPSLFKLTIRRYMVTSFAGLSRPDGDEIQVVPDDSISMAMGMRMF
ncbi:hypothetical protein DL89DRAFT_269861 [Linderina pennispora]|uniref:F-box domain-containing protein n=1 Tax=Linderina pennispora TaxID=61395 RepID=A0A1Y1VZW2_9FUNG|nr:uncharacterized protein DL89DRAFT_269861 [Linderina pennispora]ORX66808.1 hypothetical protein DL89DRAFT_269861 [Linderina pennispora]